MKVILFTTYNPESPNLQSGNKGNFIFKDKENPFF
jgi:hypothetical protein